MLRFIWHQLRGRPRRTLALLAGVLVATTGFTVLSASAAVSELRVDGTVEANYRPAYDILVRPKATRTPIEDERGLVRPNYLSGLFGGITTGQLDQIRSIAHIDVAAPIAMAGYARTSLAQTVDLTDQLDPTARHQLFRLSPSWIADRGLTVLNDAPQYVYVSRDALYPRKMIVGEQPKGTPYEDGTLIPSTTVPGCVGVLEVGADGGKREICQYNSSPSGDGTPTVDHVRLQLRQIQADGKFAVPDPFHPPATDRLIVTISWDVLALAAAIDPAAEAALVDIDKSVVNGRYLRGDDKLEVKQPPRTAEGYDLSYLGVPALLARRPYVDEQVQVTVQRLGTDAANAVPGKRRAEWVPQLAIVPGTPSGPPVKSAGVPEFAQDSPIGLGTLYQSGSAEYDVDSSGRLRPRSVPISPEVWRTTLSTNQVLVERPPVFAADNGFRPVSRVGTPISGPGQFPALDVVGQFDPERLRGFSPLSKVPLETYQAPQAVGADAESRRLLGNEPLQPNSNPAGYLATPPLVLTNFAALDQIAQSDEQRKAPISAVRVRVRGVTGFNPDSRERVRVAAERIANATGLDVDMTLGSSPAPQTVVLPAGKAGRPELTLSEGWSRKGVAVMIVQTADRKSLALFGLILVVCALFLANAVAAAVRDRRTELAVLACLGWPARSLAGVVLGEVTLVGLVAGGLAAAVAVPLSQAAGVSVSIGHALLAVPVGLGIALLAAAVPVISVARARLRPPAPAIVGVGRGRHRRTVFGLALANLLRVPSRTALGTIALAIGIAALTMLVAIAVGFHNDVIGSLLGDAVAVRVRTVDVLAAVAAVLLGVFAVADVLYINVRERAGELAALWAAGWSDRALIRLVAYEGFGIGVLGGVLGAGAALGGVALFVGEINQGVVWLVVLVAAAAVAVATAAAVVPALLLRRLPLSTLLAEE